MTTYRSIVDQLRYSGYGVPVGLPRGKWNACGRYDSLGRRQLVTQYDDATVGVPDTVVDEVKFTYEDWGNVSKFEQDHNSAVGASGSIDDYEVRYTYAKATAGRNTIRRTKLEHLYVSTVKKTILFDYLSTNGEHDNDVSRVTQVKIETGTPPIVAWTTIAIYDYLGVGQIVGTDFPEPDVFSNRYLASNYDALDNFNRVEDDIWYKDLATDVAFFDLDISYDRGSNITAVVDNIHVDSSSNGLYDTSFTIDNLNRLTKSQWGDWNGTTLTNEQRETLWTLTQTGNWDPHKLDLNDDDDYVDAREFNDDRTHNDANELTGRDTDDNGTDDYTLTYDAAGNLTDDGENYEYEYDPFGRLRKVKKTSDQALVTEYTYNGRGHRITWHYDTDTDNDVDVNDSTYRFIYDERWRIVGTFRDSDSSPKEQFVYHNAGTDGRGSSSYIDNVILRDKDATTNWEDAADALDERIYYCHNWRGDISVLIEDDGDMVEWVKYSAYGKPFGIPTGDQDSDGDLDSTDVSAIQTWGANPYDVRADLDLNGTISPGDGTAASNASLWVAKTSSGRLLGNG